MYILSVKSGFFLFVVVLSLLDDFWLGPMIMERLREARNAGPTPPPQSVARRLVLMTARMNLLVVLAIVVLAVLLIGP